MRVLLVVSLLGACAPRAIDGTTVQMNFERGRKLWRGPIPSNDLLRDDGTVSLAGFVRSENPGFVEAMLDVIERDARGFSTAAPIYLPMTGSPSASLVDAAASVGADAPILLLDVSADSAEYLSRRPFDAHFLADGGPYATQNLLVVFPVQGRPLRPNVRYAAIVRRSLGDADGKPLGVSLEMSQLVAGVRPTGMSERAYDDYRDVLGLLERDAKISPRDLAGLAVFTTDDPTRGVAKVREAVQAQPLPTPNAPFVHALTFPEYCVFETTIDVPVFQAGMPPYFTGGGDWQLDADGAPILQTTMRANLIVSLPRAEAPPGGFPTVAYMRQGGPGKWPLVERGARTLTAAPVLGTGPARELARAGFAGVSLDGPLTGLRNPGNQDEQLLTFNFLNPVALRDNIRQGAIEIDLLAALIEHLVVDASACGGSSAQRFDAEKLVLFGHSTGAWVAAIAAAFEPRFRAVILSGAGASWVENIVYKRKPLEVKTFAEQIVGYGEIGRQLTEIDPLVMLAQWAADPADPQNYASKLVDEPPVQSRHVLMFQGVVDNYIMPPIANALALRIGVDLGVVPDLAPLEESLERLLPIAGRGRVSLPLASNRSANSPVTVALVQHPEDGIEDGHEIVFQREEAKYQYRCFLKTFASTGVPVVPQPSADTGLCP